MGVQGNPTCHRPPTTILPNRILAGPGSPGPVCQADPKPLPPWPREPYRPINPDRDLTDAGFDTKHVPGKKGPTLPSQTTWFDVNEGLDDDGCVPASESAACESCLYSASQADRRASRACMRAYDTSSQACYTGPAGLARISCLDAVDEELDACEAEASEAYDEAEASCEAGSCFGDC